MRHFRLEYILLYLHRISVFTQNLGQTQIFCHFGRTSVLYDDANYCYAIEVKRLNSKTQYFFESSLTHIRTIIYQSCLLFSDNTLYDFAFSKNSGCQRKNVLHFFRMHITVALRDERSPHTALKKRLNEFV